MSSSGTGQIIRAAIGDPSAPNRQKIDMVSQTGQLYVKATGSGASSYHTFSAYEPTHAQLSNQSAQEIMSFVTSSGSKPKYLTARLSFFESRSLTALDASKQVCYPRKDVPLVFIFFAELRCEPHTRLHPLVFVLVTRFAYRSSCGQIVGYIS